MKSPLRWVGGKSKLVKNILTLLPETIEKNGYVEPFGGAAWLLCAKPASKWEVLNDFDHELINFFNVVKNSPSELIEHFEMGLISREIFEKIKKTYKDMYRDPAYSDSLRRRLLQNVEYEDIVRAHNFFYLNQSCFGGDMKNPSFGASKEKSRLKISSVEQEVRSLHNRISGVTIECLDFEKIIEKYDSRNTFFFIDPPYIDTKGYSVPFSIEDHVRLYSLVKSMEGRFMLTINDCKESRDMYKDFNIIDHDVYYSKCKNQSGRTRFKELIVLNYNPGALK